MKKMRSSGEVILPKMGFRLGATTEMKRNAFFFANLGNAFGSRGVILPEMGCRLGATPGMKRNAFCL